MEEEKKDNKFLIVLVILLSVLVLALAGTVVVMMLNNKKDKSVASNTTTTVETTKEGDSTTTSTTTSHPGVQGTQATYNPVEGNLYSYDEFWPLEMSEVITKVELNKEYMNDTNFKIELAFMEAHYTLKSDEYTKSGEEASGAIRYKRSEFEKLYKDIFKEDFNVKNLTSSDDYDDNYIYTSYPTGMGPEDKIFEFKQIGQTVGGEYIIQFYQVKEDDEFHINYLGPIAYLKFKTNGSSNKQFTSFIVKNK
jgi:hypothetical protein